MTGIMICMLPTGKVDHRPDTAKSGLAMWAKFFTVRLYYRIAICKLQWFFALFNTY